MLATLLNDRKPTHAAVAFDLPGGTFRTRRLPSYKGTRDETPPDFEPQVPLMREVLAALGIVAVDKPDYEADDLLATYARMGREAGMEVLVVSGDRDTIQLVTDDVTLLYPRKGVSDLVEFTPASVEEKYAVPPHRYPELAALVGETSDNLPGVPGVGPKTAAKWIATYGGLDGVLASAQDVPGKAGESLRAHLDKVRLNRELNHLLTDLDVDRTLEELAPPRGRRRRSSPGVRRACSSEVCGPVSWHLPRWTAADGEDCLASAKRKPAPVHAPAAVADVVALPATVALHLWGSPSDAWALGVATDSEAWGVDLGGVGEADDAAVGAVARRLVGSQGLSRRQGRHACVGGSRLHGAAACTRTPNSRRTWPILLRDGLNWQMSRSDSSECVPLGPRRGSSTWGSGSSEVEEAARHRRCWWRAWRPYCGNDVAGPRHDRPLPRHGDAAWCGHCGAWSRRASRWM